MNWDELLEAIQELPGNKRRELVRIVTPHGTFIAAHVVNPWGERPRLNTFDKEAIKPM